MLTTEELLKPRYKVIADYPKSIHPVGIIINAGGRSEDLLYCDRDGPRCRHYPHLFRLLEWWEERQPEDIPEYVRFGEMDKRHAIYKIKELHIKGLYGLDGVCAIAEDPPDYHLPFGSGKCYPSDLSEYLTYKQQRNG